MIAADQPPSAFQDLKEIRAAHPARSGGEIAEMPDVIVGADNVVPTLDQSRVVIID
ncbi:hypothetical protein [Methylobacterium sp. Leaf93]|uniref:hypothetical protein n=1 Tax=Methylobacterium sp. Leaf93 TaxID=1736249 RepID=UPI0012E9534D|nr:hypothetical protein [Methylobacterium sp. Leaf93]